MTAYDHEASGIRYHAAIEQSEHNLFAVLKPSIKLDGNKWCVLYGDNIQDGVAGFGESPYAAVLDFNRNWYKKIEPK
jgi:hypothetical protein